MQLTDILLNQIIELAQEAGQHLARFYQQSVTVQTKQDDTPVTDADLFVSQFLTDKLTALFPDTPVLSEENCDIPLAEREEWQEYWLIDPLDGTQQFIDRTDQFSVLIALVQQHRPVLGIIHAPILQQTYYAMKGFGAFKRSKNSTQRLEPRHIFPQNPLKITVGANCNQDKVRSLLPLFAESEFFVLGSSGLKSALVADGTVDCYVRLGKTGEWDTAAAEILLEETGGVICNHQFQPLTYNQRNTLTNPPFIMWGDRHLLPQNS